MCDVEGVFSPVIEYKFLVDIKCDDKCCVSECVGRAINPDGLDLLIWPQRIVIDDEVVVWWRTCPF